MELLKFKTSVATPQEVEQVARQLTKLAGVSQWTLDPETPGNILSISGTGLDPQLVENAVKEAGFSAELLRVQGVGGTSL